MLTCCHLFAIRVNPKVRINSKDIILSHLVLNLSTLIAAIIVCNMTMSKLIAFGYLDNYSSNNLCVTAKFQL